MGDGRPLILSAVLDPLVQGRLDALRRAHFPPERNHLDAHVTLRRHDALLRAADDVSTGFRYVKDQDDP